MVSPARKYLMRLSQIIKLIDAKYSAVGAGEACRSQGLKTSGETETGGEGAVRADDSSAENPKETKIKTRAAQTGSCSMPQKPTGARGRGGKREKGE